MADKVDAAPLYENIEVFYQNGGEMTFPLDLPAKALEPPKEKPPPPPVDEQNDELLGNGNFKHTSSARRIKKEIRNKRTSFLGIEGQDDSYLDADLTLAPSRPDITSFLQQETKIEKMLYKKTLSHDMDAKLRDSRDSGVDVDRSSADNWYKGSSPENSSPHSRQNSEPYNQTSLTSDEEEVTSKSEKQFTTQLVSKLTELNPDQVEHLDQKLQQQQETNADWPDGLFDDSHAKEVLRFERELLQLEQEELRRQRDNLVRDQNRIIQKSVQDISKIPEKHHVTHQPNPPPSHRHSMPNLLAKENYTTVPITMDRVKENKRKPIVSEEHMQRHFGVEESRRVLYENYSVEQRQPALVQRAPPQPILPPKPRSRESLEREITMRNSRLPSANEYANVQLRHPPAAAASQNANYHPMSRHTLQALSAAPSSKLISNSDWLQAKKNGRPANYNYSNHWLVQEAEQRLTEEHRQKLAQHRHSYHDAAHHAARMRQLSNSQQQLPVPPYPPAPREDKILSVSGKRKCSHCGEELGRGAAMIIEPLSLCYHVQCFTCAVCGARLGDGRAGADVRVRGARLHCALCHSAPGTRASQV